VIYSKDWLFVGLDYRNYDFIIKLDFNIQLFVFDFHREIYVVAFDTFSYKLEIVDSLYLAIYLD